MYADPRRNFMSAGEIKASLNKTYKTFALTGEFGVGKTWITNLLAGTNLGSDDIIHTLGLSLFAKDDEEVMYVDT